MVAAVILGGLDAGKSMARGEGDPLDSAAQAGLVLPAIGMAASRAPISGPANVATNPAALRAKSAIRRSSLFIEKASGRPASATMAHRPAA